MSGCLAEDGRRTRNSQQRGKKILTKIRATAVAVIAAIGFAASLPTADAEAAMSRECQRAMHHHAWYSDGAYRAFENGGWYWNSYTEQNWSYSTWSTYANAAEARVSKYC